MSYPFDLQSIFAITTPLGISWHPVEKKGHDFASITEYGGFLWDLDLKRVSISEQKCSKYLGKVLLFLQMAHGKVHAHDVASLHGTLQHLCFVFCDG